MCVGVIYEVPQCGIIEFFGQKLCVGNSKVCGI